MVKKKNSRKKVKKINEKEIENEFILYAFLLSSISLIGVSLRYYTFPIMGFDITYSIFVLPIILFVSNYITKKFNFKYSLKSIIISTLIIIAFIMLIDDLVGKQISWFDILSQASSHFISLFINLAIYYYIVTNIEIKKEGILIYFCYIFTILVNHITYMFFIANFITDDKFWAIYFISVIIEALISILLSLIDVKIKRGIE